MSQDFPNMKSLESIAKGYSIQLKDGESELDFRKRIAQAIVDSGDSVMAMEVLTGKGWDKFNDAENLDFLALHVTNCRAKRRLMKC